MLQSQFFAELTVMALAFFSGTSRVAKEPPSIAWTGSWEQAFEKAKAENRPLLIAMNAEGMVLQGDTGNANEVMAAQTYRDEKVAAASLQSVNLISSPATHPHKAVKGADGQYRKECTKFPGITCEEHQEIEKKVRREYFKEIEDIVVPQHLLISPDGSLMGRREYQVSEKELAKMIQDACKAVGKPKKVKAKSTPAVMKNSQSSKKGN